MKRVQSVGELIIINLWTKNNVVVDRWEKNSRQKVMEYITRQRVSLGWVGVP